MKNHYPIKNAFQIFCLLVCILPFASMGNLNTSLTSTVYESADFDLEPYNLVSIDEQNLAKLNRISQIVTTFDVNKAYAGPKLKDGRYFVNSPKYSSKPIKQIRSNLGFAVTSFDDESEASNPNDCCDFVDGKPVALSFTYLGGGCDASNNSQGSKTECTGGVGSPQMISIIASDKEDGSGDIYFSGDVALGDAFIISNNGDNFSSELFVRINGGAEILNIHTSCSAPLVGGEIFGSLKFDGLVTDKGEVCGDGDTPPPPIGGQDCCDIVDGKPTALSFTYLGGGCDASNNTQGDKTECTGGIGSPQIISVVASNKEDGSGDIYFSGDVALGDAFIISNNGDNFSSELFVRINDGEEILNIHTSCSAPLVGGEIFGSLKFDGLVTDKGEVCGEGDFPPPVEDCCDVVNGKPVSLSFSYLGGGCDASNNTQGDKTECTGGIGSPQIISVVASNKEDGSGDIYFSGDVALGDAFIISNNGDNFSSELFVRINDGAEILNIHTSCSAPLVSGEIFGSLKLNGLLTDDGEVCGEGDFPPPVEDCCDVVDGKPTELYFQFLGGGCAADANSQDDKSECNGGVGFPSSAFIEVNEYDNFEKDVYFEGNVELGDFFVVSNNGDNLNSKFFIRINGGTEIIEIHASCSAPLVTGERFGSLKLMALTTENNEVCGEIPVNCDLVVNAGGDVEVCEEDEVMLTATATGANDCSNPGVDGDCCDEIDKPVIIEFALRGGGCAAGNNSQQDGKTSCEGGIGTPTSAYIIVSDKEDGTGDIYFEGTVNLNEGFIADSNGDKFSSNTYININNGEEIIGVHTSCSAPLIAGERFGSVELISYTSGQGEICGNPGEINPDPTDESISYMWVTDDGNIVGDANMASIKVDQSGTYRVVAKDCKDCEAMDEVVVKIIDPEAGTMTADATPVCLEDETATISATYNNDGNIPDGYAQLFVLTAGDDLVITALDTAPQFSVASAGKYTIHSLVVPEGFTVPDGVTTGGEVAALLVENGGTVCASLDVPGAMIIVEDQVMIGDFVFNDEDRDGIQDDGEEGVNGVSVELFTCDGISVDTTVTADSADGEAGFYSFKVCPNSGEYYLVFGDLPEGFEFSAADQGDDDSADSDAGENGQTECFEITNEDDITRDAGINQPTASLGDTVFLDENQNGIQDDGEAGVEGVVVNLLDCDENQIDTTTTDGNGNYGFADLDPNVDYIVEFVLPDGGFVFSPADQGGDDATDSDAGADGRTPCTDLAPGENNPTLDAGIFLPRASLGDTVFLDENQNGIQDDGEAGVEGVVVNLLDCDGNELDSTTTDGNGNYGFADLDPNVDYIVEFELPTDFEFSPADQGGDDATDSDAGADGRTPCTDLAPGENNPTLDAGIFLPRASLGDTVFLDENQNGIQDDGEAGVEGVVVNLLDCDGNQLDTTTTDGSGNYGFADLDPNVDYIVEFVLPEAFEFSPVDAGDDALDSDAGDNGRTPCTDLAPGENNITLDAGIFVPCPELLCEYRVGPEGTPFVQGDCNPIACEGELVWLSTVPNEFEDQVVWTGPNDFQFTGANVIFDTVTAADAGTYIGTYSTVAGCEASIEIVLTVIAPNAGSMTADSTPVCLDEDTVTISASYNNDGNVPTGYAQFFVLTAGDDLVITALGETPEFPVTEAGKYTIHSLVVPEGFTVPDGVTTGGEVASLLIENGGTVCASLDVPGAMIIVNPVTPDVVADATVCTGAEYVWDFNGETYTAADSPVVLALTDDNGCPYTATLTINEYPVTPDVVDETTVCTGAEYVWDFNGETYTAADSPVVLALTDDNGCPYTATLTINEYPVTPDVVDETTVCTGAEYVWDFNGETYTAADSPVVLALTDDNGCPYTATLTINEYPVTPDVVDETTVCTGAEYVWDFNGETYTAADSPVVLALTDDNGCPYTATLTINEYPVTPDVVDETTVCTGAEYVWDFNGETYTAADSPVVLALTDDNGCPYTATLTINEYPVTPDVVDETTVCTGAEYVWDFNGETYTAADSPVVLALTDDNGCPYTATLTINEYPVTPDVVDETTVCTGAEYVWDFNGETYTAADSPVVLALTDDNGCPYTATLTINEYPVTPDVVDETTVCTGAEYVWDFNGETYTAADSPVVLALTDDNGCPYTATLTINEYPVTPDVVDETTVCTGAEYVWDFNGETYTAADSPVVLALTDDNGCPYTATLTINEYPVTPDVVDETTVCTGAEYVWDFNGETYTAADSPVVLALTDDNGCPYTATLTINEYPVTPDVVADATVCTGAEYVWDFNGETYTAADSPVVLALTDDNGCPYTATLTINEYPVTPDVVDETTVCTGAEYVWDFNGETYTAADSPVVLALTDDNGCPYTATLTINEYPVTPDVVDETTVCTGAEYVWDFNGETYTAADSPVVLALTDDNGCPYTATLTINEYPVTPDVVDETTVCTGAEYVWDFNGETYTAADSPVVLALTDDNGCPYTATLTINEYPVTPDVVDETTVCTGAEYVWDFNGETYTAADSPVVLALTDDNGCPYTATLTINEYPVTPDVVADATVCTGAEYVWDFNGETYTAADSPVVLALTDDNGCPYTATLTINEYPVTPDVVDETTVCTGAEYVWDFNGETYTAADSPVVLALTDDNGCPYTATLTINEYPVTPDVVDETTVCTGAEYVWDFNGETYTAADSPVVLALTDDNGCPYTATLTINEYPVTPDVVADATVCTGAEYVWDFNGETYTAADSPVVLSFTDDNGCPYTATLTINEFDPTEGETTTVTVCEGDSFEFEGETYTAGTYTIDRIDDNGCSYTDTLVVNEDEKVTIGDFVFEDVNGNGLQDDGSSGVNGVAVTLYMCDDTFVETTVTTFSPDTQEPGFYSFEVCPNSGSYYLVFGDIPDGFEFTTSDAGDDALDSDAGVNGVTECFDISDTDDSSRDAGIKTACPLVVQYKIRPRDVDGTYLSGNETAACLGDDLILRVVLPGEEGAGSPDGPNPGTIFEGWVFTFTSPAGNVSVRGDAQAPYQNYISVYGLDAEDFGEYTVSWTSPDGCEGQDSFSLAFPDAGCGADGTRASAFSAINSVFPVPAVSGGTLTLVINTANGLINPNTENDATKFQAMLPANMEDIEIMLYDSNGRMVNAPVKFAISKGRDVVQYPLEYLSTGNYIIIVKGDGWSSNKQIIVK